MDMKPVEETYGKRFFARRKSLNWRIPIMADAIVNTFNPETVIDLGCATGDIISGLIDKGIYCQGIEGSSEIYGFEETGQIAFADIRKPLEGVWIGEKYSLVMSLEVAEHIEPEYAEQYVKNLCSLGNTILITAAHPGQGGHGHVNCRPKEYWMKLFGWNSFERNYILENHFMVCIEPWRNKKGIKAYYYNCMVFESNQKMQPAKKSG